MLSQNDDPLPLYFQLQRSLKLQIEDGTYAPGAALPTEAQLCKAYGVSRITVGKALDGLVAAGAIVRRRGVGTFVSADPLPAKSVGLVGSLDEMLARAKNLTRSLMGVTDVVPPDDVAAALELEAGVKVKRLEALFHSGDEPYSYSHSYVRRDLGERILADRSIAGLPTARAVEAVSGKSIGRAEQTVDPIIASQRIADHLSLKRGAPILRVCRTYFVETDETVLVVNAWYHPQRYRYRIQLLAGGGKQGTHGRAKARRGRSA